jgi:hypothetical protein
MTGPVRTIPLLFCATALSALAAGLAHAQEGAQKKPPVGVPQEAKFFRGKWYHVYLERMTWRNAREKCKRLGGQMAVVPDEATNTFIRSLASGLRLWLGASDEKGEGLWMWVDGTRMTYTAWYGKEPSNGNRREHFLEFSGQDGSWNDLSEDEKVVVGYICEWKAR